VKEPGHDGILLMLIIKFRTKMQVAGLIASTYRSGPSLITSRRVSPIRHLESRSFLARHFEPIV
jgi:hypothetical protein